MCLQYPVYLFFYRWATKLWSSPWNRAYQIYCSTWIHKRDPSRFPRKPLCLQSESDVWMCGGWLLPSTPLPLKNAKCDGVFPNVSCKNHNTSWIMSHWHAFERLHEENAEQCSYDIVRFLANGKNTFSIQYQQFVNKWTDAKPRRSNWVIFSIYVRG